ncbi:hypothetical protein [Pseudarthrobacter sulfonivorans]|uniref:hypothetical protein n=1 Tax=Pseudarthrobacter sulfonivorans TaxID=121292 RepID=UPI002864D042|nr:hypothetical protein [Pseudarthrobacter sulfonivorans]MDR6415552.1 hypothetical protein [Pseudarthrobacter sulfonivorans]
MNRNQDIDTLLRTMDAADHRGSADSQRASIDFCRIITTDPASTSSGQAAATNDVVTGRQPRTSKLTARRVAWAGGMVAIATAGLVLLPSMSGGDPAFATWTAAPAGMSETDRARAADQCRADQKDVGDGMYSGDVEKAALAVAERRGVWTAVVLAGEDGFSALCITDDSVHLFSKGMIGSVGKPAGYRPPGSRELMATDLGTGRMDAGEISLAAGGAGAEIVGVVYKSQTRGDVTATVSQGRFALWLPGNELQDAPSDGVEVEVTYRDGTTGTNHLGFKR